MGAICAKDSTKYVHHKHTPENANSPHLEQTALVAQVGQEFNCLPVENEEFRRISEQRALEALKPRKETVFIEKIPGKILQSRTALPSQQGAFVVCLPLSMICALLTQSLASYETPQSQATGKQVYTDATKRVVGQNLRPFPRVPILAV